MKGEIFGTSCMQDEIIIFPITIRLNDKFGIILLCLGIAIARFFVFFFFL